MADQSYFGAIVAAVTIFITLTVLTTAFRVYIKVFVVKQYGWEEWLMIAATLATVMTCGAGAASLHLGLLEPSEEIPRGDLIAMGHILNIIFIAYEPGIAFVKLSVLLQITRIFIPIRYTGSWYAMMAFITINMLYYVGDLCVGLASCFPRSKTMDQEIPGMCEIWNVGVIFTGTMNAISDYCMLAMPIFWITRLHMSASKKVVGCAVFIMGVLACAASTVRLVISVKHQSEKDDEAMNANIRLGICRAAELTAGILCGNLPSVLAFIKYLKDRKQPRGTLTLVPSLPESKGVEKQPPSSDDIPDLIFLEDARKEIV